MAMTISETKWSRVFYLRTLYGKPLWTNGSGYNLERKYQRMWEAKRAGGALETGV
jgi:hypothetical protein